MDAGVDTRRRRQTGVSRVGYRTTAFADALTRLLRAAVTEPGALEPPASARAQVLLAAAHGFKSTARNTEHMRQLIRDMVGMTLAALPA